MMTTLTNNSKLLMSTLLDKKVILHDSLSKKTQHILKHLYNELKTANHYVRGLQERPNFYRVNITKIEVASQIPKPKTFNASSFQKQVREHIDQHILYSVEYKFSLIDREITIYFMTEEENTELQLELYNEYVVKILVWLYMVHNESSNKCAKQLTLYFYLTSLKKELPKDDIHILNEMNVNTAFTYTCPVNSEIVVYRKEEWFKVFMHESFHNFALDFSDMNTDECTKEILGVFPVKSEVNLYESYTEFWAETINILFRMMVTTQKGFNQIEWNKCMNIEMKHQLQSFESVLITKLDRHMDMQIQQQIEAQQKTNLNPQTTTPKT